MFDLLIYALILSIELLHHNYCFNDLIETSAYFVRLIGKMYLGWITFIDDCVCALTKQAACFEFGCNWNTG